MKKFIVLLALLVTTSGLVGCDNGVLYLGVDDTELDGFYLVDTEGYSSEHVSNSSLVIDPYENEGIFELYWYVDSYSDYTVFLTVNDRPSVYGAVDISQEDCGYRKSCDADGIQVCEYTTDFQIGCGVDLREAHRNLQPIGHLLDDVPDKLYFNIEVCGDDGFSCDVRSIPVSMY